jgi:hypothetical protein
VATEDHGRARIGREIETIESRPATKLETYTLLAAADGLEHRVELAHAVERPSEALHRLGIVLAARLTGHGIDSGNIHRDNIEIGRALHRERRPCSAMALFEIRSRPASVEPSQRPYARAIAASVGTLVCTRVGDAPLATWWPVCVDTGVDAAPARLYLALSSGFVRRSALE